MNNSKKIVTSTGFGLMEVVIATAILTIVGSSFTYFYTGALDLSQRTTALVQSNLLLEEGVEVVRLMRDDGWTSGIESLATSTEYHLSFSGTSWISTSTNTLIDGIFDRTITFNDVYRDGNQDLTSQALGSYATGTKQVTVSVTWFDGVTSTRSVSTYISNIFE